MGKAYRVGIALLLLLVVITAQTNKSVANDLITASVTACLVFPSGGGDCIETWARDFKIDLRNQTISYDTLLTPVPLSAHSEHDGYGIVWAHKFAGNVLTYSVHSEGTTDMSMFDKPDIVSVTDERIAITFQRDGSCKVTDYKWSDTRSQGGSQSAGQLQSWQGSCIGKLTLATTVATDDCVHPTEYFDKDGMACVSVQNGCSVRIDAKLVSTLGVPNGMDLGPGKVGQLCQVSSNGATYTYLGYCKRGDQRCERAWTKRRKMLRTGSPPEPFVWPE